MSHKEGAFSERLTCYGYRIKIKPLALWLITHRSNLFFFVYQTLDVDFCLKNRSILFLDILHTSQGTLSPISD